MRKSAIDLLRSNKGISIVSLVIAFGVIIIITALVTDIGMLAFDKARLSSGIDAAALAGAQELATKSGLVDTIVHEYADKNIEEIKSINISVNDSQRTVTVSASKFVESYFSGFFGNEGTDVLAAATARVENISSMKGVRPLAVIQQTFKYGQLYTLKEGAGDGTSGNYAAIALGGTGGSTYRNNLLNGFPNTINAGDLIQTETGNISGSTETSINQLIHSCTHTPPCTYQYYNRNCLRIVFIPIVNTLDINGRKYVKILGFGTFFLEGVANSGGHTDVIGRFITYNAEGETSTTANDYGTYGIRLIR